MRKKMVREPCLAPGATNSNPLSGYTAMGIWAPGDANYHADINYYASQCQSLKRRMSARPRRTLSPPRLGGGPSFLLRPLPLFLAFLYAARVSWPSSPSGGLNASSEIRTSWRPPPPRDPNNLRIFAAASSNFELLRLLAITPHYSCAKWAQSVLGAPRPFPAWIPASVAKDRIPQRVRQ